MKQKKEYLSKETLFRAVEMFQQCYSDKECELPPVLVKIVTTALDIMKQFIELTPSELVTDIEDSSVVVSLRKDSASDKLVHVLESHWLYNQENGEVRCKNCNALVGVTFADMSNKIVEEENKFCYNCGARMTKLVVSKED